MGILHAFWKSFDDVFANKSAFIMSILLIAITLLFIVFLNNAISGQICNYSSNIYGYYGYCPPTFAWNHEMFHTYT